MEKTEQDSLINNYTKQMAENHAFQIDKTFWLVVKERPKWLPVFLYKAVIKELVEFQKHKYYEKENNLIEKAIEIVLTNSTPSNEQMEIVRALRKL